MASIESVILEVADPTAVNRFYTLASLTTAPDRTGS